jgi:uncharacterized protein (TIGR00645 family)
MRINLKSIIQKIVFASKWLVIPFILKLFWTLSVLLYHFIFDGHIANGDVMITLEAVDTVMIATLVKMIITGSYHSFVDKNLDSQMKAHHLGCLK